MTSTRYSIAAAHRITGKSRTTIAKHIQAGKLSCIIDSDGKKIEASELIRVYGNDLNFNAEEGGSKAAPSNLPEPLKAHSPDVDVWKERVEREQAERERERQLLQSQIEHLKEALAKAQEGANRATLLLENQSGSNDEWKRRLSEIEEKLTNREQGAEQKLKEAAKETERLKKALAESTKRKGLLKRLFE